MSSQGKQAPRPGHDLHKLFLSILLAMDDPLLVYDEHGYISFVHTQSVSDLPLLPEQLLGQKREAVFPASDHTLFYQALENTRSGKVGQYEICLPHQDNNRWYLCKLSPLYQTDRIIGALEVWREISHLKQTEASLAENRDQLQSQVDKLQQAEQKAALLARFPDENPNPVLRVDASGVIVYHNKTALPLLESLGNQKGETIIDYCRDHVEKALLSRRTHTFELTSGDTIYFMTVTPFADDGFVYIYGNDITEQKQSEDQLRLAQIVFETTVEGITVTDAEGTIESVNPAFCEITGYSPEEVIGKTPRILKSDRHPPEFYTGMWDSLLTSGSWRDEIWNRRKNGETYPEWLSINAIRDERDRIRRFVAVFNDITELKRKDAHILHQAYHDPLTDLPNRNLFNDRLETAMRRASRYNISLALVFLDLDHFKHINDSLGHIVGDYLLQAVARRLHACIRQSDTLARVGGDEFVFLLDPISDPEEAAFFAQRMIEKCALPFHIQEHELYISPSIGISLFPADGTEMVTLWKNADMAMYHAKHLGRNTFQFFAETLNEKISKRVSLDSRLRHSLEEQQLQIHYQPIVDARTDNILGAEALLRWNHPELGYISPLEFIPLAEETGFIKEIGEWLLLQVVEQAAAWDKAGLPPIFVSINVSARQMEEAFLVALANTLKQTSFPPGRLSLELTENLIMENRDLVSTLMERFRALGVGISIDDFGTGYSSLAYLKQLPVTTLKIDRSFVMDLPQDKEGASIVRAIIAMTTSLNLKVIAEGVETREQLAFLREAGCALIQGYCYSRPVPAPDFAFLLENKCQ